MLILTHPKPFECAICQKYLEVIENCQKRRWSKHFKSKIHIQALENCVELPHEMWNEIEKLKIRKNCLLKMDSSIIKGNFTENLKKYWN